MRHHLDNLNDSTLPVSQNIGDLQPKIGVRSIAPQGLSTLKTSETSHNPYRQSDQSRTEKPLLLAHLKACTNAVSSARKADSSKPLTCPARIKSCRKSPGPPIARVTAHAAYSGVWDPQGKLLCHQQTNQSIHLAYHD